MVVDNSIVMDTRPKSIPLPCALLALSVVMCIGAAGPVEASALRGSSSIQADQRETIEHLLGAIQQAAKKLSDQLTGQAVAFDRHDALPITLTLVPAPQSVGDDVPGVLFLREALLNLPPPSC